MTYDFEMRIDECPKTIGGSRLVFECDEETKRGKIIGPAQEFSLPLIDAMRGCFPKEIVADYLQFEKEALKQDVWHLAGIFHAAKLPELLRQQGNGTPVVHPPIAAEPAMK